VRAEHEAQNRFDSSCIGIVGYFDLSLISSIDPQSLDRNGSFNKSKHAFDGGSFGPPL